MLRTLWWAILVEVGRLVLLSAAVLVLVIAFAATVKPIADGKLTAAEAVRFMLLAVPPMLAYALPFAAGFGTTLAYHRLAQDNEVTACQAGGISYTKVLAPAAAVGLALTLLLAVLNDRVIPRFLTGMEKMVTQDFAQVMIRSMQQGEAARFGNVEIHADTVRETKPEEGSPNRKQILLTRVAALETDRSGAITHEVTAGHAWVLMLEARNLPADQRSMFRDDDDVVVVQFRDAVFVSKDTTLENTNVTSVPARVPSAFRDDPKFLSGGELADLRNHPERMNSIDERRVRLAKQIAGDQTLATLSRLIREDGVIQLRDGAGRLVRVQASDIRRNREGGWELAPIGATGRIEVEIYRAETGVERSSASAGRLRAEKPGESDPFAPAEDAALSFELELEGVTQLNASGDARLRATTEQPAVVYRGLVVPNDAFTRLRQASCDELLEAAAPYADEGGAGYSRRIAEAAADLDKAIGRLGREITSKMHERWAMAASCFVMVVLGAVMAIRLKDRLPLVVYLWSFFPALGTIVLISAGQRQVYKNGLIGLPILWGGILALAIVAFVHLRRVSRN
jgi:lipopolysaccharide export LptBFGC system permease protein LptF